MAPLERLDDWYAANGSIGGVRDKHRGISFNFRDRLARPVLDALYEQNAIVARVVDKIVDDAFEAGWRFKTLTTADGSAIDQAAIKSDLDDMRVDVAFAEAAKWSRLYGGALTVLPAINGGKPKTQLKVEGATLLPLVTIPEERARPLTQDVGVLSPTYGTTLRWQIDGLASSSVELHHSRVFVFEPIKLPLEALQRRPGANGWGPSVLERIFDELGRDGAAASHAVSMMYIASILYVQLDGYRKEHATKGGPAKIRAMLASMREHLDSLGVLGLDAADKIGNLSLAITGAHELMDRTRDRVCAVANYPREVLYNESPAGLNAGELSGPRALYHKTVASWWGCTIKPHLDRFLEIYFRHRSIPVTKWELELCPLWVESDKETSENHARNAAADVAMITAGVVSADEVREQRFVQGNAGQLVLTPEAAEPDLEITPEDVAAASASSAPTVADEAMNGAQIASLISIMTSVNTNVISYQQGLGALAVAFPSLRGREASVLGPPPDPNALPPAPAAAAQPSADEMPGDRMTVQAAAERFGVKTRTITRMIDKGLIKFWAMGSHRVVSLAAVEAAAKAHEELVEAEDPADPNDQGPDDVPPPAI